MEENKKQETILDTANTKETRDIKRKGKNRTRMIIVISFILIFAGISYIQLRGSFLEYKELGEKYIDIFYTNIKYRYGIMAISFIILYIVIYLTNRGIKKGLKPFFEKEGKQQPKLPNKSLALVISAIASIIIAAALMQKIMLFANSTSFGIQDSIFGLDISFYMFQKPVIEAIIFSITVLFIGLSLYTALYYIIVFNRFFDGIDGRMLKQSLFMKKIMRNILLVITGIAILTILNVQNMVFEKLITINEDIEIIGAGITETTVKLWGYVIFAFIIIIFAYRALKYFKEEKTSKVLKNLAVIPSYLIVLFFVMVIFDMIFVGSNELDREKDYIADNINSTRNAYNINIEETNIENSGTVTEQEVGKNSNIINNIPIISKEAVLKTLGNSQTGTGYFSYKNANIAKYAINGNNKLVYIAPREIINILSEFINYKRCWYLLEKWGNKGFYNYGVTTDMGWFEAEHFTGEYQEMYLEMLRKEGVNI